LTKTAAAARATAAATQWSPVLNLRPQSLSLLSVVKWILKEENVVVVVVVAVGVGVVVHVHGHQLLHQPQLNQGQIYPMSR